jgi:hypothetical protein
VSFNFTGEDIDYLLSPKAIRDRTGKLYQRALDGEGYFHLDEDKIEETAMFVMDVIQENYPDLDIPFHSRWGHFNVGGLHRIAALNDKITKEDLLEKARLKLDLVITSVLLDAGAGMGWRYKEASSKSEFSRSEGLAIASLDMFNSGLFSKTDSPYRVDGEKLLTITKEDLYTGFQVSDENPIIGLEGRLTLLKSLGKTCLENSEIFKDGRPGNILDYLIKKHGKNFEATDLLKAVLLGLGPIWPGRIHLGEVNLGDVWHHSALGTPESLESLVPFHKLSQWLSYSMVEPILAADVDLWGAEKLTGLAEYRNGGLFLDKEVIKLKDPELLKIEHEPGSELIIEWRALTIQLLDRVGTHVQKSLGKKPFEFPLAKVLEGGTWWAGRRTAKALREDGGPPLNLKSDGTVF